MSAVWKLAFALAFIVASATSALGDRPQKNVEQELVKAAGSRDNLTSSDFHGFALYAAEVDGVIYRVAVPEQPAAGKPWVWRARFWGHQSEFDVQMLKRGWHVCYCDVGGLFGSDAAVERWDRFYKFAHETLGLHRQPFLEGMSRGGLIVMRWAARYPLQVSGIYVDNAVMDFRSWPGATYEDRKGSGKGSAASWKQCLEAYGLTEAEALRFQHGPLNHLEGLAEQRVPIFTLINEADDVVPPAENSDLLVSRYRELGGPVTERRRPDLGHHPHGLADPSSLVRFALASLER